METFDKFPIFYEVGDTLVKVDYDEKTKDVFATTENGSPFQLGKVLVEGHRVSKTF